MLLFLSLVLTVCTLGGCVAQKDTVNTTESNVSEGVTPETEAPLVMEYLYAQCRDPSKDYCTVMDPVIDELDQEFPDTVLRIIKINLTERHTNPEIQEIENKYNEKGMLPGVPTYIINGKYYTAGVMDKSALEDWICAIMKLENVTQNTSVCG